VAAGLLTAPAAAAIAPGAQARGVPATAASEAGLPAGQVTQSFATAWKQASSGEYLVIAVGRPAGTALYYNVCGWSNPSGLPRGVDSVLLRQRIAGLGARNERL
jgi:hypothetical protein